MKNGCIDALITLDKDDTSSLHDYEKDYKKYKSFFAESVTDLPGFGEVLRERLTDAGFKTPYSVFRESLKVKEDYRCKMYRERKKMKDERNMYNIARMSTSQKHKNFLAEPIGERPVADLPGIGKVLGDRLADAGFDKAVTVLGQYLVLKQDEVLFNIWINDICNANAKQAADCYNCLKNWCEEYL
uniref:Barrier-to-autointegration factor-like protein n=1 Tax=Glossina brevipalpis TaxID=37001 RepID=A0A1A9WZR3_9MUSC